MTPVANAAKKHRAGFTLIELLVVIAIIALLIGILLPSLGSARAAAKKLKCKINMRSINIGMDMYRDDNKGYGNGSRNQGARFDLLGARLEADDQYAYWAIVYDDYLSDALEVWEDPDFRLMDPYPYYSVDPDFIYETQRYQTYGLNNVRPSSNDRNDPRWKTGLWKMVQGYTVGRGGIRVPTRTPILRPKTLIPQPNKLIVFQDAWEHAMDNNGDTLNDLSQYDGDYGGYFEQVWRNEYFRHSGACNAMFADGHVEEFQREQVTDEGKDELLELYTGYHEDGIPADGTP